jgi:hypothetical protein
MSEHRDPLFFISHFSYVLAKFWNHGYAYRTFVNSAHDPSEHLPQVQFDARHCLVRLCTAKRCRTSEQCSLLTLSRLQDSMVDLYPLPPGPQRLSQLRFNANETRLLILKEKPHDWLFMLGMEE